MIEKMKEGQLHRVMDIWLQTNILAHPFIPREHWENLFDTVKDILPSADIFIYRDNDEIKGFISNEPQRDHKIIRGESHHVFIQTDDTALPALDSVNPLYHPECFDVLLPRVGVFFNFNGIQRAVFENQ